MNTTMNSSRNKITRIMQHYVNKRKRAVWRIQNDLIRIQLLILLDIRIPLFILIGIRLRSRIQIHI